MAFEPDPLTFAALSRNIVLNQIDDWSNAANALSGLGREVWDLPWDSIP